MNTKHRLSHYKSYCLFIVACVVFFSGFQYNFWESAEEGWFKTTQANADTLVYGRLVQSRQSGIGSYGGFLGDGIPLGSENEEISYWDHLGNQVKTYSNGSAFARYSPYLSQTGGQAIILGFMDRILPFSHDTRFAAYVVITALFLSFVLSCITVWIFKEFGIVPALMTVISVILSEWLTLFARSTFWSLWAMYLPMCSIMIMQMRYGANLLQQSRCLAIVIFMTMLLKIFFNGFEYITTPIAMMLVPCIYHSLRYRLSLVDNLRLTRIYCLSTTAAICSGLIALTFQIAWFKGGFNHAYEHIMLSLGKRSHGNSENYHSAYASSLDSGIWEVLKLYLDIGYANLNYIISTESIFLSEHVLKIEYKELIWLLLISSVIVLWQSRQDSRHSEDQTVEKRIDRCLIVIGWCSLMGPLSWFILFKGHSFIHTFMNPMIWQMPFTLFVFALLGRLVSNAMQSILLLYKKPSG